MRREPSFDLQILDCECASLLQRTAKNVMGQAVHAGDDAEARPEVEGGREPAEPAEFLGSDAR